MLTKLTISDIVMSHKKGGIFKMSYNGGNVEYNNPSELLGTISELVASYNRMVGEAQGIQVVPQGELEDVSDVYICVYSNEKSSYGGTEVPAKVGLFRRKEYSVSTRVLGYPGNCDSGFIFEGIISRDVGIIETLENNRESHNRQILGKSIWQDGKGYVATCRITEFISFDEFCLMMAADSAEQNSCFIMGKASRQQMQQVLIYAYRYYVVDRARDRGKV